MVTTTKKSHTFINIDLRIPWSETISNRELWKQPKQQSAEDEIPERHWERIQRTLQKPMTCTTHQALTWNEPTGTEKARPPEKHLKHLRLKQRGWITPGVCWLVGCLTSQQQASVFQGRVCSDNFTCCHTEIEVADQTFYLTQSQYTDTGPTSPSADPITPGAWQGSHWSANL